MSSLTVLKLPNVGSPTGLSLSKILVFINIS